VLEAKYGIIEEGMMKRSKEGMVEIRKLNETFS